ncbi:MAG TPA: 4'-phosphopantetheinyl transferase superfamily protein [Chitinophagaceae bacterium]|nr:4'-phosphopantetheinyl transferase superfamily protein [Chitinophagaceae bacterium]
MSLFYQQDINETTRLGVWKIEEDIPFFLEQVPLHREITHPHKKLQHLAGRYLLKFLFPDFPYELIRIADTRKPFLHNEQYHFSISHSGDYAAAIVSSTQRVGVDVELYSDKVMKVLHKFLSPSEHELISGRAASPFIMETLMWSVKESVFKWHGNGGVDFREHIHIQAFGSLSMRDLLKISFKGEPLADLDVFYYLFGDVCLSWVSSDHTG